MTKTGKLLIKTYMPLALAVLVSSTLYWAYLGAKVQYNNADQLVNAQLFEDATTFSEAFFPGSHTFFIKWPLFLLERLLGFNDIASIVVTVGTTLATVGSLAYLLYRIERRPLVFGTICLALSSVLMLIPIEAAPGALLPVNMAMLATRNLEYIVFICSILLVLRAKDFRQPWMWAGLGLLSLLAASDKLFLSLALGSSLMSTGLYLAFRHRRDSAGLSRWLAVSVLSALGAAIVIRLLQLVTSIADSGRIGPYQLASGLQEFAVAAVYGLLHILTNFGANPASKELLLRDVPAGFMGGLVSISGPSYLVNLALLAFCLWAVYAVIGRQLQPKRQHTSPDIYALLVVVLMTATLTAIAAFVATKHYYAGDARYLAIGFFSLVIAGAVYIRDRKLQQKTLLLFGAVCLVSTVLAVPAVEAGAGRSQKAYAVYTERNRRVTASMETLRQAVPGRKIVLAGDYWRVIPVKQATPDLTVTPLSGCTAKRGVLSSEAWQPDLGTVPFAYLLSLDANLTGYPRCTLDQIIQAYGNPSYIELIDGSRKNPKEVLLMYDKGSLNLL